VAGVRWVQLVPSHSQVSLSGAVGPSPPNNTSLLPSAAITAPLRAGGLAAGDFRVHAVPSHSQVSPWTLLPMPPKSTTLFPRVAIVPPWRRMSSGTSRQDTAVNSPRVVRWRGALRDSRG
jgi:hypothetical protein